MPDADTLQSEILEFIRTQIAHQDDLDLDVEENLFTSGLVDSVSIMRLIAHMEKRVGARVPHGELVPENFRNIAVMARFLAGMAPNGGPA